MTEERINALESALPNIVRTTVAGTVAVPVGEDLLNELFAQAREANRLRRALEKSVQDWHDGKAYTDILREAESALKTT